MKTSPRDTKVFQADQLDQAAQLLQAGELVAFPTETVYGLGAIANNDQAVRSVYQAKGRPSDNPLIVHVCKQEGIDQYVEAISPQAQVLMDEFWPGPLTIIFPCRRGIFAPSVTGGMDTVAIRMPRQALTLALIEKVGFPLVGPSANLSGKPSPTQVDHVLHDLSGLISGVVANNLPFTDIGVESTVVYPEADQMSILRPGAITQPMIQAVSDLPVIVKSAHQQIESATPVASPGVKYRHYSPKQPVESVSSDYSYQDWKRIIEGYQEIPIGILASQEIIDHLKDCPNIVSTYSLGSHQEAFIESATRRLFSGLRYLEESDCQLILVELLANEEASQAYLNRLSKASRNML
ncbi:L-threonylcarbamoyladenylate synthase [Hutsoniella sourekii]